MLADVITNICGGCFIHILQHEKIYLADVIAIYVCGRCYNHWGWCYCLLYFILLLADVIANVFVVGVMTTITLRLMFLPVLFDVGWCYYQHMWWMFYPHIATWEDIIWLMLLPYMSVADVITTEADVIACYILFYFIIGWCYCQYVADVIATFGVMWWQMLLPSGRCYGHCRVGDGWWLILLPPGRWCCQGSMIYFNLSSGMLKQNLIPYMWQMVFANISIKGWVVDPYV